MTEPVTPMVLVDDPWEESIEATAWVQVTTITSSARGTLCWALENPELMEMLAGRYPHVANPPDSWQRPDGFEHENGGRYVPEIDEETQGVTVCDSCGGTKLTDDPECDPTEPCEDCVGTGIKGTMHYPEDPIPWCDAAPEDEGAKHFWTIYACDEQQELTDLPIDVSANQEKMNI